MPITPDLPFPKNPGDAVRSKDWNDLVTETQRLDNAKVNRLGDAISGPLTIAGALSVGTTNTNAKLDLVGDLRINDSNLYLRQNTDTNHGLGWFGLGKLFGGANVDGPVLFGWSGGALGTTNGGQKSLLSWNTSTVVVNGAVQAGNSDLYFTNTNHNHTGFGNTAGYAAIENTVNYDGLMILGRSNAQVPGKPAGTKARVVRLWDFLEVNGDLRVNGDLKVNGRAQDQKIRSVVGAVNAVSTTSLGSVVMPNMSLSISAAVAAWFQIHVQINGVQATGGSNIGAHFRLVVDGMLFDFTRHEFNHNGWELRGVTLSALSFLAAGTHTISVEWYTSGGTLTCCWYNDSRNIQVVEI
jgi:hypothetical protein